MSLCQYLISPMTSTFSLTKLVGRRVARGPRVWSKDHRRGLRATWALYSVSTGVGGSLPASADLLQNQIPPRTLVQPQLVLRARTRLCLCSCRSGSRIVISPVEQTCMNILASWEGRNMCSSQVGSGLAVDTCLTPAIQSPFALGLVALWVDGSVPTQNVGTMLVRYQTVPPSPPRTTVLEARWARYLYK